MKLDEFVSRRRTVSTPSGDIAVVDVGDGPPAVFLHGVFLNGYLWRNVLDEVMSDRRCVVIDLLGHGATRTRPDQDVSMPAQARMLAEVCDALSLGQIDLVGNDSGAAIAQIFAVRHPERLRSLTLTNTDTHTNLPPPAFVTTVEAAAQGAVGPFVAEMLRNLELARSDLGLGVGFEHPELLNDETIRVYLEPFLRDKQASKDLERFILSFDAEHLVSIEPKLRELKVPTLVVWGTADVFFEMSWAYWLQETIPGVREVVELDGAKLFFPEERAAELAAHLRRHWAAAAASAERVS